MFTFENGELHIPENNKMDWNQTCCLIWSESEAHFLLHTNYSKHVIK